ncbi:hypothetical protein NECAME_03251 [Necator americanus]|uniref:Uncharacterized protein n=1 Tax=Necator americanus TaxID=51031 RepID=W2T7K7_NECAM|nr:hypothetical protein NECAME_03251 [Necator americanus]ETN77151.1 hypothetical protein NECAME_03251 [Necator americanus]
MGHGLGNVSSMAPVWNVWWLRDDGRHGNVSIWRNDVGQISRITIISIVLHFLYCCQCNNKVQSLGKCA